MASFWRSLFGKPSPAPAEKPAVPPKKPVRDDLYDIEMEADTRNALQRLGVASGSAADYAAELCSGTYVQTFDVDFGNSAVFPSPETASDALKIMAGIAEDDKEISVFSLRNVHPRKDGKPYFTDDAGRMKVTEMFALNEVSLSDGDFTRLSGCFEEGGVKTFSVRDTSLRGKGALLSAALGKNTCSVHMMQAALGDEELKSIAAFLPVSGIETLAVGRNGGSGADGLTEIIAALPPTTKEIDFSGNALSDRAVDALCARIPDLANLKSVSLQECGLTSEHLARLVPALPDGVYRFSAAANPAATDEGIAPLVERMRQPGCGIYSAGLSDETTLSPEMKGVIADLEAGNYLSHMEKTQEEKARKISQIKDEKTLEKLLKARAPEEIKALLPNTPAFNSGGINLFDYAMDKLARTGGTLEKEDLLQKDDRGRTVAENLSDEKMFHKVMRADLYKDVKALQGVYDLMTPEDKAGLNDMHGACAFIKVKNQVMAETVKRAVARKTAQR